MSASFYASCKIERPELKRHVWLGAGAGLLIALTFGIVVIAIFESQKNNIFVDRTEQLFEGCLMLFASFIITVLAVSMLSITKFQEMWERKLNAKLAKAAANGTALVGSTLFWIPLASVLREGVETVIFLAGVGAGYPGSSIPIPGLLGLLAGFFVGYILYKAGSSTTMNRFMIASTVILLFIAAGMFAHSIHEFSEAGVFGPYENAEGETTGLQQEAWNICSCCDNDGNFWSILRALIGYTCNPSYAEIVAYVSYWIAALFYLSYKLRLLCFKKIPLKGASAHAYASKTMNDSEELNDKLAIAA